MKLEKNYIALATMLAIIVASIAIIGFKNPKYTANAINTIKSENVGTSIGNFAPDFELESIAGGNVKLSDFKGKAVILNFWASWCPPCKEEMPLFENAYRAKSDKIVVIGVNLQESRENIKVFIKKFEISFPILLDPNSEVKELYNVFTQPVTYFINKEGKIIGKKFGPLTGQEISEKVDKLII